jgi:hypothetical protein
MAWDRRLLNWLRVDGGWSAWHAGREHVIAKLARDQADGRGGWYLCCQPDAPPGDPRGGGPFLAATLEPAWRMAEVWAVTGPADRQPYDDAPNLVTVMGGGGAVFRAPAGQLLIAWPDNQNARIAIHADSSALFTRGPLLGTITPRFTVPPGTETQAVTVT